VRVTYSGKRDTPLPPASRSSLVPIVAVLFVFGFTVLSVVAIISFEPSIPIQLKYEAGDMLQLKLTGEKVLVIAHHYDDQYMCKIAEKSTHPLLIHKTVYIFEAELEPITGDVP